MEILTAVLCVGGIGIVFGILLAVASKFFAVEKDPRLDEITEALPGANCGGCGYAGCANMAAAILEGSAPVSGCPVGGETVSAKIAEIMGVGVTETERTTAVVLCSGNCGEDRFNYEGITDCLPAAQRTAGMPAWVSELACRSVRSGRFSLRTVLQMSMRTSANHAESALRLVRSIL